MGFISGEYLVTYTPVSGSATSVGQLKDGIKISHTIFKQGITGDNYAKSRQDAVWQGQDVFTQFTLLEYNAAAAAEVFWPYGATYLTLGVIGRLDSAIAGSLILTALAGTPAAVAAAPATVTLGHTILAEGYPVELLFYPVNREIPVRMQAYPYIPSSTTVYGTLT